MQTTELAPSLHRLFSELVDGLIGRRGGYILNSGDEGLLRSLDKLSAADASRNVNEGATIAAHTQHLRYGLSLMNEWATGGGDPFANAKWDEAWKMSSVDDAAWQEIRSGLRGETQRWMEILKTPREAAGIELSGLISSIGHFAYHMGAIRQINKAARGPREGTF
jgi:hypothetical protein